ncbi:MAG: DUF5615 family PIN-like protein [Candidatus Omnitrophica bacterium]|nr:DUF5615 family PIN-like protein [Candidatus Omnitrophota bacterium]
MKFLIDENIRREIIDFLAFSGHDILRVPFGSEDKRIAQIAKDTERIMLTHDQHFANILMYPPKEYSGIIRIKIHPPIVPTIINALRDLFQKLSPNQLSEKLVILERDGFRIR